MRGTGAIVYNDCDCVVYDDYANCETVIYTWTACDSTVAVNILSMLHPSYLLLLVHCGVRSRFFLISVSFLPVPTADTVHVLCLTSAFSSLLQNIFYHVFLLQCVRAFENNLTLHNLAPFGVRNRHNSRKVRMGADGRLFGYGSWPAFYGSVIRMCL